MVESGSVSEWARGELAKLPKLDLARPRFPFPGGRPVDVKFKPSSTAMASLKLLAAKHGRTLGQLLNHLVLQALADAEGFERRLREADVRVLPDARACSFPQCGRPRATHGLCGGHAYQQRHGQPLRALRVYKPRAAKAAATSSTGPSVDAVALEGA